MKLSTAINIYVQKKRSGGRLFNNEERGLVAFCKDLVDPPLETVSLCQILAYLNNHHASAISWNGKYLLLRNFFRFWAARDAVESFHILPLRLTNPITRIPHIYSRMELRTLLKKTRACQRLSHTLDAYTLRTLLLFLYATGACVGETLALTLKDLDLKKKEIALGGNGACRSRCIPLNSDLAGVLRSYLKKRNGFRMPNSPLFSRKDGGPILKCTLSLVFVKLRRLAGMSRSNKSECQPWIHDLRSTFAVHRIASWIKEGQDLNKLLLALSAYLGQARLISIERYLFLTPERFRQELNKLSPQKSKKKWRNDPVLMSFLSAL